MSLFEHKQNLFVLKRKGKNDHSILNDRSPPIKNVRFDQ